MTKIDWTKPIENDNGPCEYLGTINRSDPYVHIVKCRYSQHSLLEYIIYVNAQGKPSSVVEFDPSLKIRNVEPQEIWFLGFSAIPYGSPLYCLSTDAEELKKCKYTHAVQIVQKGDKITSITPITL